VELVSYISSATWEFLRQQDLKLENKGLLKITMLYESGIQKLDSEDLHAAFEAVFRRQISSSSK
jgi:hypothetical protein